MRTSTDQVPIQYSLTWKQGTWGSVEQIDVSGGGRLLLVKTHFGQRDCELRADLFVFEERILCFWCVSVTQNEYSIFVWTRNGKFCFSSSSCTFWAPQLSTIVLHREKCQCIKTNKHCYAETQLRCCCYNKLGSS